jgi:hypothetical protein
VDVDETVRARVDGVTRERFRVHVHDRELAALVCRIDDGLDGRLVERRPIERVRTAIVKYDLDVIGTFRDARVDERLRRVGRRDRRDRQTELRAMTARRGHERTG